MDFKKIGIAILFLALAAHSFIWLPLSYVSYYFGFLFAGASVITFIKGLKAKKLTLEEEMNKKKK
jgi:hypothetical protein